VASAVIFIAPEDVLDRVFALRKIEATGRRRGRRRGRIRRAALRDLEGLAADHPRESGDRGRSWVRIRPNTPSWHGGPIQNHRTGARDNHSTYPERHGETGSSSSPSWASTYHRGIRLDRPVTDEDLKKTRPATSQVVYAMEVGAAGFFVAASLRLVGPRVVSSC
jgi:hypothetical protein